jgi:hypothetical protein
MTAAVARAVRFDRFGATPAAKSFYCPLRRRQVSTERLTSPSTASPAHSRAKSLLGVAFSRSRSLNRLASLAFHAHRFNQTPAARTDLASMSACRALFTAANPGISAAMCTAAERNSFSAPLMRSVVGVEGVPGRSTKRLTL